MNSLAQVALVVLLFVVSCAPKGLTLALSADRMQMGAPVRKALVISIFTTTPDMQVKTTTTTTTRNIVDKDLDARFLIDALSNVNKTLAAPPPTRQSCECANGARRTRRRRSSARIKSDALHCVELRFASCSCDSSRPESRSIKTTERNNRAASESRRRRRRVRRSASAGSDQERWSWLRQESVDENEQVIELLAQFYAHTRLLERQVNETLKRFLSSNKQNSSDSLRVRGHGSADGHAGGSQEKGLEGSRAEEEEEKLRQRLKMHLGAHEDGLIRWLLLGRERFETLKNFSFELIPELPNKTLNICEDGPKILMVPNSANYTRCFTRAQHIERLWSGVRLSPFHYPFILLNILIFLIGTTGNIFVCLSVKRNHQLRSVTNYFIVNLAFADFLVILICLPATVVWDLSLTWFFDTIPCKLIMFLQDVSISVSVLTLTAISIDRYYAICHPLRFKSNLSQAKRVIALIWLVSLSIMAPDLVYLSASASEELREAGIQTVLYSDCNYHWSLDASRAFQFVKTILLYLIPFLLMFIAHFRILQVLRLASSMMQHEQQYEQQQQHTQLQPAPPSTTAVVMLVETTSGGGVGVGGAESAGNKDEGAEKPMKRRHCRACARHKRRHNHNHNRHHHRKHHRHIEKADALPVEPSKKRAPPTTDGRCARGRKCRARQRSRPCSLCELCRAGGESSSKRLSQLSSQQQQQQKSQSLPGSGQGSPLEMSSSAQTEVATGAADCPASRQVRFHEHPVAGNSSSSSPSSSSTCDNRLQADRKRKSSGNGYATAAEIVRRESETVDNVELNQANGHAMFIPMATFNADSSAANAIVLTMHNKSKLESRRKAAKMLTAIVVLFGLCYLPVHLINFLRQFIDNIPQTDVTSTLSMLAHCVCYLNSAINPIIYNHMNSVFRAEFRKFLSCLDWRTKATATTTAAHSSSVYNKYKVSAGNLQQHQFGNASKALHNTSINNNNNNGILSA